MLETTTCRLAWLALVLLAALPARVHAQGGPPLITDDPDTPGPGFWEVNLLGELESTADARAADAPRLDLNYGIGDRIELKFEIPWSAAEDRGDGSWVSGLGDGEAGIKWRFLGEEGKPLSWSVYPQFAFNTAHSSVTKGLVPPGNELLLPTEITLEFKPVEMNLEVGRSIVEHDVDSWFGGVSTEATVAKRIELVAELFGERVDGDRLGLMGNLGGRLRITKQLIVLAAAGRTLREADDGKVTRLVAGLQLNLPEIYTRLR